MSYPISQVKLLLQPLRDNIIFAENTFNRIKRLLKNKIIKIFSLLFLLVFSLMVSTGLTAIPAKTAVLHLIAPRVFSYGTKGQWNALIQTLRESDARTIIIDWKGIGGYVSIGKQFIDAEYYARAHGKYVIINIIGYSASMHALAPCAASEIRRQGAMMFHLGTNDDGIVFQDQREVQGLMEMCIRPKILNYKDIMTVMSKKIVIVYPNGHKKVLPDNRPMR